ncbi:GNAT family protein [Streptomyces sp. BPTC-684]|uniref:GNAT family N-acetyltransferase n=1 Tax=Streptomyces sp. BPTC-684 TaxID=3043734 RepID=UPI0024B07B22|nr:GNAT family protein [Streptomyces sp. BPTC-684]WHM36807.1 GNAT family protein [Streptomyces sp. BPTC-684]
MDAVTLTTRNLDIHPVRMSDLDAIVTAWSDPAIRRWTVVPEPGNLAQAREFVESTCAGGWSADRHYIFGAYAKDSGSLVGCFGVFGIDTVGRSEDFAYLGCWVAKEHRGKGYATEALREIARWAFTDLKLDRLEGVGEVGNEASLALVLKTGFQMEGTLRGRTLQDGIRRDAWLVSLLPHDLGLTPTIPYAASNDVAKS